MIRTRIRRLLAQLSTDDEPSAPTAQPVAPPESPAPEEDAGLFSEAVWPFSDAEWERIPVAGRAAAAVARRMDTIRNTITGLGGNNDRGAAARPNTRATPLQISEIAVLYENNSWAGKAVDDLAIDATSAGWFVNTGEGRSARMDMELKRLQSQLRTQEGFQWGRLFGGALVVMMTTDDVPSRFAASPQRWAREPLDLSRVKTVDQLVVYDAQEFTVGSWQTDPSKAGLREPETWRIYGSATGALAGAEVHHTRCLYIPGRKAPPSMRHRYAGIDISILQRVWPQIRNLTSVEQAMAVVAQDARLDVITVGNMDGMATEKQRDAFLARMQLLAKARNLLGVVLLHAGEKFERRDTQVQGYEQLASRATSAAAAASDIPVTRWTGDSPGGLNSDGDSHRSLWSLRVQGAQETILRPLIERQCEVIFAAKEGPFGGEIPEEWSLEFTPIEKETDAEKAQTRLAVAQADEIYLRNGVYPPEHVQAVRFRPTGFSLDTPQISEETKMEVRERLKLEIEKLRAEAAVEEAKKAAPKADRADATSLTAPAATTRVHIGIPVEMGSPLFGFWQQMQLAVMQICGEPLLMSDPPHITLLMVGDVPDEKVERMASDVQAVLALHFDERGWMPIDLFVGGVSYFPPEGADLAMTPLIMGVMPYELEELYNALLRGLAPYVSEHQFLKFVPHITLGYLPRELTGTEVMRLRSLEHADYFGEAQSVLVSADRRPLLRVPLPRWAEHRADSDLSCLEDSAYPYPDWLRVDALKREHPDIWAKGRLRRGEWTPDRAYRLWTRLARGEDTALLQRFLVARERTAEDLLRRGVGSGIAGAVSLLKWGVQPTSPRVWSVVERAILSKRRLQRAGARARDIAREVGSIDLTETRPGQWRLVVGAEELEAARNKLLEQLPPLRETRRGTWFNLGSEPPCTLFLTTARVANAEETAALAELAPADEVEQQDAEERLTSLRESKWPRPDYARVKALRDEHPDIWSAGGEAERGKEWSGDRAFGLWTDIVEGRGGDTAIEWINVREAWAARQVAGGAGKQLAGAVALLKWAVEPEERDVWAPIEEAIERKAKSAEDES